MTLQAIRERYGVPARRNKYVQFEGRPCYITQSDGHHLRLRDMTTGKSVGPCHPLWEMDYLDGVDYGARYDARIDAFNAAIASSRKDSSA